MTDINKQIEEESNYPSFQSIRDEGANRAVEMKSYVDRVIGREFFEFGAKWMLEKWKHSSRWRKASEELPEGNKDVLVKVNIQGYIHFEVDRIIYGEWMNGDNGIIEWKPID